MALRDMQAFAAIDRGKVEEMLEVLGDGIAFDPLYRDRMRDLQKMGLTMDQASDMIDWFYDFYIGARNPALMLRMLEAEDADGKAKEMAIDTFKRIVDGRKWPDDSHDAGPVRAKRSSNEDAFDRFVYEHRNDPEFEGKCVAFVNGEYQGCGTSEDELVHDMHEKFGYVRMMVGPVTAEPDVVEVRPPELA